jgi:hypothetical protein
MCLAIDNQTEELSRLSLFRLDVEVVQFRRVRCSSGAECSPHHRNSGLLGQFTPYIWG